MIEPPPGWVYDDAGRLCKESDVGWIALRVRSGNRPAIPLLEAAIERAKQKSGAWPWVPSLPWALAHQDTVLKELGGHWPDTGHSYIHVYDPNGKLIYEGRSWHQLLTNLYPGGNYFLSRAVIGVEMTPRNFQVERRFRASPETMQKVVDIVSSGFKKGVWYSICDTNAGDDIYHCTTWAMEVLQQAGLPIKRKRVGLVEPFDLREEIRRSQPSPPSP